jgi:hypothetical protein
MVIIMMTDLEQLVNETFEDLCRKYPLDDHQGIMRASFEIFAFQLVSRERNEFNRMMNRIKVYRDTKAMFGWLEK